METKRSIKITATTDNLNFGYWCPDKDEWVVVDAGNETGIDIAAEVLDCPGELVKAIALFADSISRMVGGDLRDIWRRLDNMANDNPNP